jgi:hypothetical protein
LQLGVVHSSTPVDAHLTQKVGGWAQKVGDGSRGQSLGYSEPENPFTSLALGFSLNK